MNKIKGSNRKQLFINNIHVTMLVARDDNHKNLFLFLVFHVDIIDDAINLFGSHGFK